MSRDRYRGLLCMLSNLKISIPFSLYLLLSCMPLRNSLELLCTCLVITDSQKPACIPRIICYNYLGCYKLFNNCWSQSSFLMPFVIHILTPFNSASTVAIAISCAVELGRLDYKQQKKAINDQICWKREASS